MKKLVERVSILSIPFANLSFDEFTSLLFERMQTKTKTFVVTANPEIVMYANAHESYKQMITQADFIVPDGIGIIKAANTLKTPLKERVTGYDTTIRLLEKMNEAKLSVYVLGGKEEVLEKAVQTIESDYPNVSIAGCHHGYFDWEDKTIAADIKKTKPDLILVALGFPRQEQWIYEHFDMFDRGVFIGVGGTIDVLAGTVERAPMFWQKIHLEWLYRLLKQPSRWKRMLAIPKFLMAINKEKKR
ncbi:MAG TPA: WecB/TagA/CpsF family glycosyltransferase [Massilibacterium sp.]|nr:WecB/TagA/CpsF family glycosyltransferase [Massilibacterium sp.]